MEEKLIFTNLLNGVSIEQVGRHFNKSENEIMGIFSSMLRQIKSYCFQYARGYTKKSDPTKTVHAYPIIVASSIKEAQGYRMALLKALPNVNFTVAPKYKDIQGETIKPDNISTIARNLS